MTSVYSIRFHFASVGCWWLRLPRTGHVATPQVAKPACPDVSIPPTRMRAGEDLPEAAQTFRRQPREPVSPHACRLLMAQSPAGCFPLAGVLAGYVSRNALTMRLSQCVHWSYPFHQQDNRLLTTPALAPWDSNPNRLTCWLHLRGNRLGFISLAVRYRVPLCMRTVAGWRTLPQSK